MCKNRNIYIYQIVFVLRIDCVFENSIEVGVHTFIKLLSPKIFGLVGINIKQLYTPLKHWKSILWTQWKFPKMVIMIINLVWIYKLNANFTHK